jgi:hypothetical protein
MLPPPPSSLIIPTAFNSPPKIRRQEAPPFTAEELEEALKIYDPSPRSESWSTSPVPSETPASWTSSQDRIDVDRYAASLDKDFNSVERLLSLQLQVSLELIEVEFVDNGIYLDYSD